MVVEGTAEDGGQGEARRGRCRAERNQPDASRVLDLLGALSHGTELAVGCYCADEGGCHRSVLRAVLAERGALIR